MTKKHLRVKGHALLYEGACRDGRGYWTPIGPATCTCGWQSEELTSDFQRKQAHREHKLALIAEQESGQ